MSTLTPWLVQKFYETDGVTPANGHKIFTYEANSSTKKVTRISNNGSENTNPVITNSDGTVDGIWLDAGAYKIVQAAANDTDPPNSSIKTWDYVNYQDTEGSAGAVNTLAELKDLEEGEFTLVTVFGGTTVSDRTSSQYRWDSTSVLSDDGFNVIEPTITDGTGRWIRLRDTANSIDDLKTFIGVPGSVVNVSGYYTAGDGKAIEKYWYDPTLVFADEPDNGGTIIQPLSVPAQGGWRGIVSGRIVTFENFGAVGDGSTDDLTACNNAINWVCRFESPAVFDGSLFRGGKILLKSMYAISDELQIDNYGVAIEGERFIIPDGPSKYGSTCGFRYIGTLDATKSCLKVVKNVENVTNTGCFNIQNVHFDANDLCGFGFYLEGAGRSAISETTQNNRGTFLKNLSYVGYIKAGQVIGSYLASDLDDPNAAQFENLSIENLRFSGGGLIDPADFAEVSAIESIGLFVNAGNLEFGVCNNLYFDPPATRAHKHHVYQRLGGLIINGIVSTRAGSASVVYGRTANSNDSTSSLYIGNLTGSINIPWAIVSFDQMIINGWRMEDRWAFKQAGTTFNAPSEIRNVVQRPDAQDSAVSGDYGLFTLPTDNVFDCQGYDSSIKLVNITTNASVSIGSSSASLGEADIIFSRPGGVLTVSGTKQYGKYVDGYKGDYKFMGKQPRFNLTDENNNTVFENDRGSTYYPRFNPNELDELWVPFNGGQSDAETVTFSSSGGLLVDFAGSFANDSTVRFTNSGGALPTGLAINTDYFLNVEEGVTVANIATSRANLKANTYIAYTDAGTGTHTMHKHFVPVATTEIIGVDSGSRGTLLGVTATISGAYLTAGKEMPASGYIHLNNAYTAFNSTEELTGINALTNGASLNLIDRWIPYTSGSGNVPSANTLITGNTSASTGYLVEVCATLGGSPTAPASPMPASGYIHLENSATIFNSSEALTGIGATTNGAGTLLLDNYDIGYGTFIRLNPDSATTISGLESTRTGRFLLLTNVSSFVVTLTNNGSRSSPGNKFTTNSGTDLVVNTNDIVLMIWDVSSNVWRVTKIADPYTIDFLDGNGQGKIYRTATNGAIIQAYTGTNNDFELRGMDTTSIAFVKTGTNELRMGRRFATNKGADLASANNVALLGDGNFFSVTGTTEIRRLTSTGVQAGTEITLMFAGALTVKNDFNTPVVTDYTHILLAGASDFVSTANDMLTLIYTGTVWIEKCRTVI